MALSRQPAATQESAPSASSGLLRELFEVVVLAVILYFGISFAIQTVHVEGLSMFATLDNNDYLIADKLSYRLHGPERGDIVILRPPTLSTTDYIKRVIGLPGERILIRDAKVYINGHQLIEPYLPEVWVTNTNWGGPSGELIPPNDYFVLGDNRNRSQDSRVFGFISRDRIDGRAWFRIWPLGHFGNIYDQLPTLDTSTVSVG
jgi:signal peptidase I